MTSHMRSLVDWIRHRLLPALVTAAGVALLAGGLLTYQDPPGAAALAPSPPPAATERPTPSLLPLPPLGPVASTAPSSSPVATRVATRVVVPALRIDLPVVKPPPDPNHFPYCDVAEYLPQLSQPGYPGTTYLYAHARVGMFLPLLETADAKMLGMLVQVYTNDNQVFLYEITQVLRNQSSLDIAFAAKDEQLMLQTSEGPRGTVGKTMIVARPISVGPADPGAANPVPKPIACE
jgi:Sortase domain